MNKEPAKDCGVQPLDAGKNPTGASIDEPQSSFSAKTYCRTVLGFLEKKPAPPKTAQTLLHTTDAIIALLA